jgi:hypothetical protein
MIVLDLSILNQKGTPMFNSDLTANRPAAGIVGRIFIAIDSPYGIFRDTGTAWDQISSAGGADTNIYNTDGTLTGTRTISSGGFQLVINPQTTFFSSLTASTSGSSFSVLGSNALSFAAGFSSSNIGNVYGANGAINAQIFSGNATFAQANLASAMVNVNKIDFSSAGGHTITMTQSTAPGIRAMTGVQNQIQFTGSHNGTISHAAISQNLGFFRDTGSTKTLTITNAYSHLINPLDDYGAGFTFTNRWGIYQAGASDNNYFAGKLLIGTNVVGLYNLDVSGGFRASSNTLSDFVFTGSNANYTSVAINNTATNGRNWLIGAGATSGTVGNSNFFIYDATSGNTRLVINSSGYLGLNKVNPSYPLDLSTATNALGGLSSGGSVLVSAFFGNGFYIGKQSTTDAIVFAMFSQQQPYIWAGWNGTTILERMRLTETSNLLLGTSTDVASSILTLSSTTKGFLPPRMTNAQRIAISTPAVGLIVYCTDSVEGLYINKSTGWTFII